MTSSAISSVLAEWKIELNQIDTAGDNFSFPTVTVGILQAMITQYIGINNLVGSPYAAYM